MSVSSSAPPAHRAGRGHDRAAQRRGFGQNRRSLIRWMGVSFALAGALSACGKKGPLELPPPEPVIGDEPMPDDDPGAQQ